MKNAILTLFGITMFICTPQLFAGVWTDPFDGNKLVDEWEFRDRREKVSTATVKDGFLRLTNPTGNWGHMTADKTMLERDVPKTAQDLCRQWTILLGAGQAYQCVDWYVHFRR